MNEYIFTPTYPLICAIDEGREPYNSARHTLRSLQMTLTACRSADADGQPMTCEEVGE